MANIIILTIVTLLGSSALAQTQVCKHKSWPAQYDEALQQAVAYWPELVYIGPCTGPGQVPVKWASTWKRSETELGVTAYHSNGFIQILINPNHVYETGLFISKSAYHLQSVIAHELGHVIKGPNHEATGLMQPYIRPGEIQTYDVRDPNLRQYTTPLQPLEWYPWVRK